MFAKIDETPKPDRAMAKRLHAIVKDQSNMRPSAFALKKLTAADEARFHALISKP